MSSKKLRNKVATGSAPQHQPGLPQTGTLRGQNQQPMVALSTTTTRSGPLPDPTELAHYDQVLPGAAERIFRMAELQQEHRIELEKKQAQQNAFVVEANAKYYSRGQGMAFLIATGAFCLGTYMATHGQAVFATALFSSVAVTMVANFISGKAKK